MKQIVVPFGNEIGKQPVPFRQVIEINIIPAEVALTGELLGRSDILNLHSQLSCGAIGERGAQRIKDGYRKGRLCTSYYNG